MTFLLAALSLGLLGIKSSDPNDDYVKALDAWRLKQAEELQTPRGWLRVAGLFWLPEGTSTIGSAADNAVVLPKSSPAHLGQIVRSGSQLSFHANGASVVTVNGQQVSDSPFDGAHEIKAGPLTLTQIARGSRVGIRMYDDDSPYLKDFKGLKWFPIESKYKVVGTFVPYTVPKSVPITNVLGDVQMWPSPGIVTFKIDGHDCSLIALSEGDTLFFNFRDQTSGKATYPAGRFLYADKPEASLVELDFNKATNPPCAFTAYATCPLPPKENILTVAIPAGEKVHHPH